jgi:hypothetical protein
MTRRIWTTIIEDVERATTVIQRLPVGAVYLSTVVSMPYDTNLLVYWLHHPTAEFESVKFIVVSSSGMDVDDHMVFLNTFKDAFGRVRHLFMTRRIDS